MRALVNTAPGVLELLDWPRPQPGPGQVLIRTAACGICATDMEMVRGWKRTGFPSIPGHEWSGRVEAVGKGADPSLVGRHCVAENVLSDGGEVGFEHPGGYGEFLVTEAANVLVLPDGYPLVDAALIEPLAVCVRAASRLRLAGGQSALVFGDGPIGLLMVALLSAQGVKPIAVVGGREPRLALARGLGASRAFNYHALGGGLAVALLEAAPDGFDGVVEASGSAAAMAASIELAGRGGKVLVVGDYGAARADFPWNVVLHRELSLIGSNASAGAWPDAVRLAVSGAVQLGKLVTRVLPVDGFEEAIALVRDHDPGTVKVVLAWA